jgi:NADH-quinone oxidoreductase subunit H
LFLYCFVVPYFLFFLSFICILGESNRVPYDLPEAESELVAGFITEYSSILFSLILLTEYASIIAVSFLVILCLNLNFD